MIAVDGQFEWCPADVDLLGGEAYSVAGAGVEDGQAGVPDIRDIDDAALGVDGYCLGSKPGGRGLWGGLCAASPIGAIADGPANLFDAECRAGCRSSTGDSADQQLMSTFVR